MSQPIFLPKLVIQVLFLAVLKTWTFRCGAQARAAIKSAIPKHTERTIITKDTIVSPEFENRAIGELPVVELPPELDSKVIYV